MPRGDPFPGTPAPNTLADASKLRSQLDNLFIVPSCRVYNTAAPVVTSGASVLGFNTERWDNDSMHNNVTNNTRLTATTAGIYLVTGHIQATNTSGGTVFAVVFRINGTDSVAYNEVTSTAPKISLATTVQLAAAQYVELQIATNGSFTILAGTSNDQAKQDFGMTWFSS